MATQLHLIHRHSATATTAASSAIKLGEIAVQHKSDDPALWIKLGTAESSTEYAKFVPVSKMSITQGTNISVTGSFAEGNLTIAHKDITYTETASAKTLSHGNSFTATTFGVEEDGHVTSATVTTYTLPSETTLSTATTGTGNAVTDIQVSGHQITTVKNKTFLEAADLANYLTGVTVAGDTYISGTVANDSAITLSSDVLTSLTTSSTSGSLVDSKAIVNFVTGQTDSALTAIAHGTDGTYVTTTVGNKSNKTQSVGVAVTTGAVTSTTAGLAVNTDVKGYVDGATSGKVNNTVTVTGASGLTGGGALTGNVVIAHSTVTPSAKTGSAVSGYGSVVTAVTKVEEDSYGHVTAVTSTKITLPSASVTAATGDDYVSASYNSSTKTVTVSADVATNISTVSSSDTQLADAYAVKQYLEGQMASAVQYMGATSTLPSSPSTGDLYVAGANIAIPAGSSATGAAVTAETGDFIIARSNGKWDVIEKNLDGAVTTTASSLTDGAVIVGNGSKTIKVSGAKGDATHPIYIDASGKPQTANTIHSVSASDGTNALAWNSNITLATVTVDGTAVAIDAKLPANPNTDTATTESGHYAPTGTTTTIGGSGKYIQSIGLDTKKHVYTAATANTADIVVNSAKTATTISGTITASKVSDFNSAVASAETKITTGSSGTGAFVTAITTDGNHQVIANLGTPTSIHDTATTETGHYTPSATSSTVGSADGFIKQIKIDSKKHVIEVTTGTPAAVSVVNSAPSLPVNGGSKVQIGTVAGTALTADVTMQSLTIAGAKNASGTSIEEFNGTAANTIAILDCGSY